jgi:arylsulfatase A-like enzyme
MDLRQVVYLSFAILAGTCAPAPPETPERPNFIFLFADDQAFSTFGDPQVHTPNLDRLAARGTVFTHAYNMGGWNGAICIASRTMLNSGRSIWRAREQSHRWREGDEASAAQSWSRLLSGAGYRTYLSGKWHVAAPAGHQFDSVANVRPGMPPDNWINRRQRLQHAGTAHDDPDLPPAIGYNRPLSREDSSWSPTDSTQGGFWAGGTHWSEVVRDDAISFLKDAGNHNDPYFLYLAFNAPHDPRQAPTRFQAMYPVDAVALPPAYRPEHTDMRAMGAGPTLRDEGLAPYPRTPLAVRTHRSEYYALITHLDEQIGLILDAVAQSPEAEHTYVIFTADHGLSVGNHGLFGKQNMYEHSVRVPFILAGPGVPAGEVVGEDIYLQDIMPTVLELAGVSVPDYVDFHSLLPLIGGEPSSHPAIYGMYTDRQRMIRRDRHKLIVYPTIQKIELYDLEADPNELNDVARQAGRRRKVESLFADLLQLQDSLGDTLNISSVLEDYYTAR